MSVSIRACFGASVAAVSLSFLFAATASAEQPLPPAAQRYQDQEAAPEQAPDFQRHIVPLMGRLGCNGRSCHGSFQGRGGFRLSLFGYDLNIDHEALTELKGDSDELRVDLDDPAASLMLQKPTDEDIHEGGKRFEEDGWEHHLLMHWIRAGAPGPETQHELSRLEVIPGEIVFGQQGETRPLQVIAHWPDGTSEDVTCLCRFRTNDESVADIDVNGTVTSAGKGDTHVVAFYDNGVAAVPVLTPVTERVGPNYPDVPTRTRIDELVVSKLRKLGVTPAEVCTDAEFLRRVSLDISGTLPSAEEVAEFLQDNDPDKRSRKIDELLDRPAYAAWWATKFCDLTGNNRQSMSEAAFRNEQSQQWYDWIYHRLRDNMPYDELVAGMMLATSRRPDQSYDEYAAEMTSYVRKDEPADFAERDTMPHYWSRNTFRSPEDRVLGISYAFLGIRIQCAQCHTHPFDQWTQEDFRQFAGFFRGINYGISGDAREDYNRMQEELGLVGKNGGEVRQMIARMAREGTTVPFRELSVPPPPRRPSNGRPAAPQRNGRAVSAKLLGAETIDLTTCEDPRVPVMEWLRGKDNAYFATALVNRVWAHYFHAGIINPPDDLNQANPPSNRELLDYLADGFIEHGFDLKWLHREITGSDAYQRSWRPNETNLGDRRNFSRAIPRRLPAEVAYDAVVRATASAGRWEQLAADPTRRAIGHATSGQTAYAMTVFGKPARETTCDCERSNQPTLLQSVYLLNDRDVLNMIDRGGWLTEVARKLGEPLPGTAANNSRKPTELSESARDELIREAYLRSVNRIPADEELEESRNYLDTADSNVAGLRDLLWALLNTKEFILNH